MLWSGSQIRHAACFVLALAALYPITSKAQSGGASSGLMVYEGQYVVELAPQKAAARASALINGSSSGLSIPGGRVIAALGSDRGSLLIGKGLATAKALSAGAADAASSGAALVPVDPSDDFCKKLIQSGTASSCSPNFQVKALATPNDPQLGGLWGLNASQGINGPGAWDVSTGTTDEVIAIIDTGVDFNHPDLVNNIWTNPGEIAGNGLDDDGDGYVDDVHGINAVTHSGNPFDDNGHGTHVAGTIGAQGNNGLGVVGVNWTAKIMALKFLDSHGSGSLAGAIEAINYMVAMKHRGINIRVVNNSWGGGGFSQSLYNAISHANDAGIIFVAAAGNEANDNDSNPSYPATYQLPNVISVAAVDSDRNVASFSNYGGSTVHIAAPGVNILSTYPGGLYAKMSGTSMATPHVTGALGLLLASEPGLDVAGAKARLLQSGLPLASLNNLVSSGRMLNLSRMLHNETAPLPTPGPTPTPCTYSMSDIPYSPDLSADGAAIVQQADEYNYYSFDLPFSFPLGGMSVNSVKISPNGVLYGQQAPASMDYQNNSTAPVYSIAALQTDMFAPSNPYGVRVASASDHVTIYWLAKNYSLKNAGDIAVRVSLYADGHIDDFIAFGDSSIEKYVQDHGTIGVTGMNASYASTYAYNSSKIHNQAAVRFTPQCDMTPHVTSIRIRGIDSIGREVKNVRRGRSLRVRLGGSGSGSVSLIPSLNGRACSSSMIATLSNGRGTFSARMPKVPAAITKLTISATDTKASAGIERLTSKSKNRVSAKEFDSICASLAQSVRSR